MATYDQFDEIFENLEDDLTCLGNKGERNNKD